MLDIGIVGFGPDWDQRYLPALERLNRRLRVRAVFCTTASKAEPVAAQLRCEAAPALMFLLQHPGVRAVLMLDAGWMNGAAADLAVRAGRPAYLATCLGNAPGEIDRLWRAASETGASLMPDFAHRYIPATARLQELMATRLGRPLEVQVDVDPANQPAAVIPVSACTHNALVCAADWCGYLVGTAPVAVSAQRHAGLGEQGAAAALEDRVVLTVSFQPRAHAHDAPRAVITFRPGDGEATWLEPASAAGTGRFRARVRCQKGAAVIEGPSQISWSTGAEAADESLSLDRPEVEVMLDHFARRVVGGLIPVPTMQDLYRALILLQAARKSLASGAAVPLRAS